MGSAWFTVTGNISRVATIQNKSGHFQHQQAHFPTKLICVSTHLLHWSHRFHPVISEHFCGVALAEAPQRRRDSVHCDGVNSQFQICSILTWQYSGTWFVLMVLCTFTERNPLTSCWGRSGRKLRKTPLLRRLQWVKILSFTCTVTHGWMNRERWLKRGG